MIFGHLVLIFREESENPHQNPPRIAKNQTRKISPDFNKTLNFLKKKKKTAQFFLPSPQIHMRRSCVQGLLPFLSTGPARQEVHAVTDAVERLRDLHSRVAASRALPRSAGIFLEGP